MSVERPPGVPERLWGYSLFHGEYRGHRLWYIGMTRRGVPIELCERCDQVFLDVVDESCPAAQGGPR